MLKESVEVLAGIFRKGTFARNLAVLTGGSFLAYVIGFLFTPLLTRIYTPESYGYLSVFNTTLAVCSAVSSLGYRTAYILPHQENKFHGLSLLVLIFSFITAIVLTLVIFFFGDSVSSYLQIAPVRNWLFLIPILLILSALYQMAESSNIRSKSFAINAQSHVLSIVIAKGSVLLLGLRIGSTSWGLICGEIVIRVVGIVTLLRARTAEFYSNVFRVGNRKFLKETAAEFANYPKLIFPSSLLVQLTTHIPVYAIGTIFTVEFLGQYSLSTSLLGIPIQILGFSMGRVFMQKANETYLARDKELLKAQFIRFAYALLLVATIGYGLLFAAGPEIIRLVAGNNWGMAGKIASLMSVAFVFELVSISIAPIFLVLKKERLQLVSHVCGSGIFIFALIIFALFFEAREMYFIGLLTALMLFRQLLIICFAFHIVGLSWIRHLLIALASVAGIFLMYYSIVFLIK